MGETPPFWKKNPKKFQFFRLRKFWIRRDPPPFSGKLKKNSYASPYWLFLTNEILQTELIQQKLKNRDKFELIMSNTQDPPIKSWSIYTKIQKPS